jgi:hypothetical protein
MNPVVKVVLLGFVISLPGYFLAKLLGEGLNHLSPHNPIGAGVVAGGAMMALIAVFLRHYEERP